MTANQENPFLNDLRQSIDHLDSAFIFIIAERLRQMRKSILFKQEKQLSSEYSEQRKQDLEKTIHLALEHQLPETFVRKLFARIDQQAKVFDKNLDFCDEKFPSNYSNITKTNIHDFQESIYHLDIALCCLFAERYHLVKKVGYVKKTLNLPALANNRWKNIVNHVLGMAESLNIDIDFMQDILEIIHQESLRIEAEIIGET